MTAVTVRAVAVINNKHSYRSNSGNTIYSKHSNDSNHSNSSSRNQQ